MWELNGWLWLKMAKIGPDRWDRGPFGPIKRFQPNREPWSFGRLTGPGEIKNGFYAGPYRPNFFNQFRSETGPFPTFASGLANVLRRIEFSGAVKFLGRNTLTGYSVEPDHSSLLIFWTGDVNWVKFGTEPQIGLYRLTGTFNRTDDMAVWYHVAVPLIIAFCQMSTNNNDGRLDVRYPNIHDLIWPHASAYNMVFWNVI